MDAVRRIPPQIAAVIGFLAAVLALYQGYQVMVRVDDTEVAFVERNEDRPYILKATPTTPALVKDHVIVTEQVQIPDEFVLIANRLEFADDSALLARGRSRVLVVANRITGGRIVADGATGAAPEGAGGAGGNGDAGGQITVVGVTATGLQVSAVGGRGGDGASGANGRSGRSGRCAGFGGWIKAEPGDDGQDGGAAGAGGPGGTVTLYGPIKSLIEPAVDRGSDGRPGAAGQGGAGGSGCVGLGGSQASRANGKNGRPGAAAVVTGARDGQVYRPPLDLHAFAERLKEIGTDGITYQSVNALLDATGRTAHE